MFKVMFIRNGLGYSYGLHEAASRGWEFIDIETIVSYGSFTNVGKVGDTERAWTFDNEDFYIHVPFDVDVEGVLLRDNDIMIDSGSKVVKIRPHLPKAEESSC